MAFVRRVGAVGCGLWVVGCRALAPRAFLLRRFRLTPSPFPLSPVAFTTPPPRNTRIQTHRERTTCNTHTQTHTCISSAFYYCALAARASEGTNERVKERRNQRTEWERENEPEPPLPPTRASWLVDLPDDDDVDDGDSLI